MSEKLVNLTISTTDTLDDAGLARTIEALRKAWQESPMEKPGPFIPGWQKQTVLCTPVSPSPWMRAMLDGEEYTGMMNWAEAEAIYAELQHGVHPEPEPLALLSYCDSCYSPLTVRRDEAMLETVLVCKSCGDRQRVTDRDAAERLSEADQARFEQMVARSQG